MEMIRWQSVSLALLGQDTEGAVKVLEEVQLEVQVVYHDIAWAVGGVPGGLSVPLAIDPGLRHVKQFQNSGTYISPMMSNKVKENGRLTSASRASPTSCASRAEFWGMEWSAAKLGVISCIF